MEHFEAQLEVDSQEVVADSNSKSCSVSRMANFVGNKAGNIWANNRFPDEVEAAVVGRNSCRDSEDMLGNASDAFAASSREVVEARNDREVLVPSRRLDKREKREQLGKMSLINEYETLIA
jgi:hypothetical protein